MLQSSLKSIDKRLKKDINLILDKDIQDALFKEDGELKDEVMRGYIEEIYMGFCECCYMSPCVKYGKERLKESKHISDMFIYKRVKYKYIEKAIDHYRKIKTKEILNEVPNLYNDVISVICKYV